LVALPPALLAIFQLGRLHPDELFQSIEPALHRAFGFGVLSWEWKSGLRNWAVPGLFAGILKLGGLLGVEHPQARRALLEVPQFLLHVAMLAAVFRLCARRVDARWARLGVLLLGSYGVVLHFAGRTLGESFSAAFLVWAFERLDVRPGTRWTASLAGALLGASVVVRYGSGVFVLAAIVQLALQRRARELGWVLLGGSAVALCLAALDWATWGKPLHSLIAYAEFNVLSGEAARRFGADGPRTYLENLPWVAPWVWFGAWLGVRARLKGRPQFAVAPLLWAALVYVAAITATPHKEPRFLYPAFVLLAVGTLPSVLAWLAGLQPWAMRTTSAALLACGLISFFVDSPFHVQRPEQFRLAVQAGREATGLIVFGEGMWGSPGYFYLGRDIPWIISSPNAGSFRSAARNPRFNRALTYNDRGLPQLEAAGFRVIAVDGNAKLLGREASDARLVGKTPRERTDAR
jgi:hypothetical protein